jgi:hypothetical protein
LDGAFSFQAGMLTHSGWTIAGCRRKSNQKRGYFIGPPGSGERADQLPPYCTGIRYRQITKISTASQREKAV